MWLEEFRAYGTFHLSGAEMAEIQKVLDKGKLPAGEDIWSRERR